jgi:dihydroorotase
MTILLKQVTIADPQSKHNGLTTDIFIENGTIVSIESNSSKKADQTIDCHGAFVSTGWVDVFSNFCDPGFEFKETLQSGMAAAAAGGYTRVLVMGDTKPVTDNKAQVAYIHAAGTHANVTLHPIGAITKKMEGQSLAEMYDMRASHAVAFSDGMHPVQSPGVFLKALQYVKAFDGILIQIPIDKSIAASGLMHEGIVSTQMGLPGLPAVAEELMVKRDIDLLRYTGSKLHITGVSSATTIELIRAAKKEGLAISCSVTPTHLFYCDEDMTTYNTNLKVIPPVRTKADREALRVAVVDGTIDCIASHHAPQDWDHKVCEFEYAEFGNIGLQTTYATLEQTIPGLKPDQISNLLSGNARRIFDLPTVTIQAGQAAELTIFNRTETTTLTTENNKSKSSNSAFMNQSLTGKVIATINKGILTNQ